MPKKLSITEFIDKASVKHNGKYDYSSILYENNRSIIQIICPIHGPFTQAAGSHLSGCGCKQCYYSAKRKTTEDFIIEAKQVHNNTYDYRNVNYVDYASPVEIICKEHGPFMQTPVNHVLRMRGCRKCKGTAKTSLQEFLKNAKVIHNNVYTYEKVVYFDSKTKVEITCPKHGLFWQIPSSHISQHCGCPLCATSSVSKAETEWLDSLNIPYLERQKRVYFTEKEFFKIDGYDSQTNTIYEYNGMFFHGHPSRGDPEEVHPYGGTYGERYQNTLLKEQKLKDMGYTVISFWGD